MRYVGRSSVLETTLTRGVAAAGPAPDHPAHDLYCTDRASGDNHPPCGWAADAGRDAAGHVFHGWRQRRVHGRADADDAL